MRLLLLLSICVVAQSHLRITGTGSNISSADAKAALNFHNKIRKEVGVAPLEWSNELAAYAQAWADHLAEADCSFEHRPYSGEWKQIHGENLFWGSTDRYTVIDACNGWYEEKKYFKGAAVTSNQSPVVGHYTQMVWRKTKRMGIGIAVCKSGGIIIVANYDPPGNYLGEKPY